MYKLKYLILSIAVLFFSSCQFSENIYFNEDGSGKMEFSFDASEIMQMGGGKMTEESAEKEMDSIFTFKEIFDLRRDSISKLPQEEQDKLKELEPFSVHMLVSEKEQKMNFDISTDFKNAKELRDMFTALNTMSNLKGKKAGKVNDPTNPFSSMSNGGNTDLSYSFKKGVFNRTVRVLDKNLQRQITDSLGQAAMMFASSKYKLKYHFPKRVKSVSNDMALFSADGKTVTVEYGLIEYIADPEIMNLEIVLED